MLAGVTIDPAMLGRAQRGDPAAVEQVLDAIATDARRGRRLTSRWVWITSLVVAAVCIVAFVVVMASGGDSSSEATHRTISSGSLPVGVVIGFVVGIAIGRALPRRKT
jgi:hypothetical protein